MKNQIITKQQPHERRVIFQKSLIEMNEFFSSTEFAAKCRENGLSVNYTGSGLCGEFLQTTAKRLTNRTWQRKNYISGEDLKIKQVNAELTEEVCIEFLKRTGKYKILVKYFEFKEI
jgi:hypothetical protein